MTDIRVDQVPGTPDAPRAERECDRCHVVDTEGHHQVVVPAEDGSGLVMVSQHFKCCADNGCPDGSCAQTPNGS